MSELSGRPGGRREVPGASAQEVDQQVDEQVDVAVIGAGPCGLAAAIAVGRAGLRAVVYDRACLVSGVHGYPTYMNFFSTAERISIGGVPFAVATEKPTRRDALAYYRTVARYFALDVRQYEAVESFAPLPPDAMVRVREGADRAGGLGTEVGRGGGDLGGGELSGTERGGAGVPRGADAGVGPPPTSNLPDYGGDLTITPPPRAPASRTPRFLVHSTTRTGQARITAAHAIVVATGYFGSPNRLNVPGEDLPHVSHRFGDGHESWDLPAVVVGGGNSAVDAALELYRAGARVTLVHFREAIDPNVKPWVMPDITGRIRDGTIAARFSSQVVAIDVDHVVVRTPAGDERVPADRVYLMLGYQPNAALLRAAGVPMDEVTGIPAHDPATMESVIPGVFIAGVLASGFDANKTFIENGRHHGDLIARRLAGGATV